MIIKVYLKKEVKEVKGVKEVKVGLTHCASKA